MKYILNSAVIQHITPLQMGSRPMSMSMYHPKTLAPIEDAGRRAKAAWHALRNMEPAAPLPPVPQPVLPPVPKIRGYGLADDSYWLCTPKSQGSVGAAILLELSPEEIVELSQLAEIHAGQMVALVADRKDTIDHAESAWRTAHSAALDVLTLRARIAELTGQLDAATARIAELTGQLEDAEGS